MKPDIKDLNDIICFVDGFYNSVQSDDLIGPIFNAIITDWSPHLEKMYHFWNAALFGVPGFKGNPFAKHAPLSLKKEHFDRWLLLFNQTIDSNFQGDMAEDTKRRAAVMAIMFLSKIEAMGNSGNNVIV